MTTKQHILDIVTRSIKTFVAAFTATLTAGGVDITHLTISRQLGIAALAAGATAVLNAGLKIHTSMMLAPTNTPELVSPIKVVPPMNGVEQLTTEDTKKTP